MTERRCPKCNGESGYYHKYIQSHTHYMDFNKCSVDSSADFIRGGTRKFCSDCERDITEYVETLTEICKF